MNVTLRGLVKRFRDGTEAVKGIDLDIAKGEFLTLLGPSGCGKTTTLRLIAGLEEPTEGSITIGERDVTHVNPGDRDVAMVFQTYALYPHMTALQNMTLGLTVAGMSKAEASAKARETAKLLNIERLLERKPAKLSGGERQRVALGRAMVRSPACLPDGRAAFQPRPQAPRAHADRAQAPPPDLQGHDHLRDPRPGRGADPLRPRGRAQQGRDPAGGRTRSRSTSAR